MSFPNRNGMLSNVAARIVFTPNTPVNATELAWWLLYCVDCEVKRG